LEASLWKELLTVEADYFHELRSNMLFAPDVVTPSEYGVGLSQINSGVMKNQGLDLTLGSRYSFSRDMQVSLKGNMTLSKNTLIKVFEAATTYNNPNRRQTGRPYRTQFGYQAIGFYLPEDFASIPAPGAGNPVLKAGMPTPAAAGVWPGDIKYQDTNGDGKLNTDDYVVIGQPTIPQMIFGINPNVRYKGFQLDLLFQGTGNRGFYMQGYGNVPFIVGRGANKDNLNYWRPDNLNAHNPRITNAPTANNTQMSSFWMQNAKYIRLKNAQIAYTLPTSIIGRLGMRRAVLNVSGQNLKTWTKMIYYDPETDSGTIGYPQEQVISVGLSATFK
jgi:hypothetical protein